MLNKIKINWLSILFIILTLIFIGKYQRLKSENIDLRSQISDYQDALNQASDNIDEANSEIKDAQDYAWSSYEDMGNALDDLKTVDNVNNP